MYESFDHFKIRVVQTKGLLGPFTEIDRLSATYSRVLGEAQRVAEKMADASSLLWDYFEKVGINPQDSFTDAVDDRVFEYLLRLALRPYGEELISFAVEENGMSGLDEIVFFIK